MPLRSLLYRRATEPDLITVYLEEAAYAVRLQRHRQARRYTLRIQPNTREALLTMPPRGSLREAQTFANKHASWIAARLARLPKPVAFAPGAIIPLRGAPHRIVHKSGMRGAVWTEVAPDGEQLLCVTGAEPHLPRRVADYFKREAKTTLAAASRRAAGELGVTVKRISIRDQTSRWGSCSTTGVLCFSWRLVLAPAFVIDYLAAHEVAHLREMNHSRRFWRLVESLCPELDKAKVWLDANGADLHRYGVTVEASR
ncbi:MAG: M48 family metallopeptidase [Pseudolabrys sp.]|nr:M48 family metallopeptidase [Pseudolabrys sp.]MBV9954892.1 M48 family metallopeptidase [Pseudolabrys sp.]